MQLIVLGMHRSGTSVVSRMLNMMGSYVGEMGSMMGYHQVNPKGFWENNHLVEVNQAVLTAQGCDWQRVLAFDPVKLAGEDLEQHRKKARNFLFQLDTGRPWAVKDPRLCLTLPFWLPLLEVPICILVYRKPLEIALSLRTAHAVPLSVGIALWERYMLSALTASSGLPRILVDYHALLDSPVDIIQSIFSSLKDLGVRKLELPSDREVLAFVDSKLHREQSTDKDQKDFLNLPQRRLCKILREGTALEHAVYAAPSASGCEVLRGFEDSLADRKSIQNLSTEIGTVKEHAASRDAELEAAKEENRLSTKALSDLQRDSSRRIVDLSALRDKEADSWKASEKALRLQIEEYVRKLQKLEEVSSLARASFELKLDKELATNERQRAQWEREQARELANAVRAHNNLDKQYRTQLEQRDRDVAAILEERAHLQAEVTLLQRQVEEHRTALSKRDQEISSVLEERVHLQAQMTVLQRQAEEHRAALGKRDLEVSAIMAERALLQEQGPVLQRRATQEVMQQTIVSLNDHLNFLLVERERLDIHLRRLIGFVEALHARGSSILSSRRWWVGDRLCRLVEFATFQKCRSVSPGKFVETFRSYASWKSNYVSAQKGRIAWSVQSSSNDADNLSSFERSVLYKTAVIDRLLEEVDERKKAVTSVQSSFRSLASWGELIVRSYRYRVGRALYRSSLGFLEGLRGDRHAEALVFVSLEFQEWSRVYVDPPERGEVTLRALDCKRQADLTLSWLRSHAATACPPEASTEEKRSREIPVLSARSSPSPPVSNIRITQFTHSNPRNPYYIVVGRFLRSLGWDFNYCVDEKNLIADVRSNTSSLDIVHFHQLETRYHASSGSVSETKDRAESLLSVLREFKNAGARLIWTMHNPLPHDRTFSEIDREFTTRASLIMDHIVVLGDHARKCMLTYTSPEKIRVVRHPSLAGCYGSISDKERACAVLGHENLADKFVFGSFGEIKPYKGLEDIIDAFEQACANSPHLQDSELWLVGKPGPPDYVRSLLERASQSVSVVPEEIPDSHVSPWLGVFDASVFCFRDIWMSSSVALSLSYLTPVIIPDLGCLPEYVSHEGAGLIYQQSSVESMAEAMIKMRTTPLQSHMRYMCEKFNRDHSVEKIASEFASVYEDTASLRALD